jgi:hypothetical protein
MRARARRALPEPARHDRLGVGGDFNFVPMWIARRTSARTASFVMLDASAPLPFADGVFGAGVCSDAFMYLPEQATAMAELRRVCGERPVALPRLGNRTALPAQPHEFERSADEYVQLAGGPARAWLYSEDALLKEYLWRRTPGPDARGDPGRLTHDKWLSVLVAPEGMPPPPARRYDRWPHEAGRLQLNPMFAPRPRADGGVTLTAWFDNIHFALQNAQATVYMPRRVVVEAATLAAVRAGERTPEVEELIRRLVIIGLPEHYAQDPLGVRLDGRGGP